MKQKILFFAIVSFVLAFSNGFAQTCPSVGAPTDIEVCNSAVAGQGVIRIYFYNGDTPSSYTLFTSPDFQIASVPFGPATINTSIPLPPGATAGVQFDNVPDGDFVVRASLPGHTCPPLNTNYIIVGGLGITVNSANALEASAALDAPDCDPTPTGTGQFTVTVAKGVSPYTVAWAGPNSGSSPLAAAGTVQTPNTLNAGNYVVTVTDANNCVATVNITVPGPPTITLPDLDAPACVGAATAPLDYTSTTGTPNQYSLDFDGAAEGVGFADVTNVALPGTPGPGTIIIAVPGAATLGVYNAVLRVRNTVTGCVSVTQNITVSIGTSITLFPDTDASACVGSATAPLAYTVTTGSPNQYSIDFNAAAQTAGFTDIVNAALGAAPDDIDIALPVGVAAGVYTGSLTVRNSVTGCVSVAQTITVTVGISITLFPDTDALACSGDATAPLAYTVTTGSPNQYSIDFNAAAQTAGFTDIVNAALGAAPDDIDIALPVGVAAGVYTGSLTVRNSVTGCVSVAQTITITVGTTITLSPDTDAAACVGAATAPLAYTVLTGAPNQYSIDFNAAAQTAGFTDIVNAALGAAPDDIDIALPVGVAAGVYTGSLTVRNSVTGCVSPAQTITVTVGVTITLSPDTDALACSGSATAPLAYTVTTGSPNQYSIDFNPAAQTAGFTDIVNAALGAAPDDIDIALPVGVAAGVYTGSLTVRNSVTGCVSVAQTITVTVGISITLFPDTDALACSGDATAPLAYTVTTGSPDQYSIDFNAAAQTAGFTDIVNAALGAAPDDIDIALPVGVAAGVYTGSLTVRNSVTGCVSVAQTITVTVGTTITLSPDTDAAACVGAATAPLAYTVLTGAPNQYSIDFNAAAQTAGFTDIVNAALGAAPDDIDIALPVGVAAGVYTGSLTVRNSVTGCVSPAQTITVTVGVTITLSPDTDAAACSGSATAPLAYTATTGSPNQYSIDFNPAAQTAGFTDIVNAALGAAPDDIDIALPVGVAAGVYTGSLTVRNSVTGCVSVAQTITVTVGTSITLFPDTDALACSGDATAPLAYTVTTGSPDQYSIDFNAAAQTAGFTDIVNAALGAAPDDIDIALPVGVAAGVYTGSLTVRNSVTGCVSVAQTITVTVGTTITLSPDTDAAACVGAATAPLAYTVLTGAPNQYSIDFNAAAQTAGFTDIVNAALGAAPDDIDIALPVGVAAGVYTGSLTVRNSVTGCVSPAQTITVTVGVTITLSPDTDALACSGSATAPLAYTVTTGSPNQYSIDFNPAAQTAGFTDIVNAALGAAPDDIDIALPVGVAAGVYTGSLTVRNSVTGCVSVAQTITVTVGTSITLFPDTDALACSGDATAPLAYTVTTGSPDQYSIDFNAAAQTAGFTDIVNAALGAAPDDLDIALPVGVAAGVYTGSLTVRNSVTGCVSVAQTITVTVGTTITLSPDTDAAACLGDATAPLAYTVTTGGANQYSIDFNAAAQTAGFTDIVNAALGAAPDDIDIALPVGVAAGVYTGSLTVRNSVTGCVSPAQTITVTVGVTITLSPDTDAAACSGSATAPLAYTVTTGSPNQYSIDFNPAAQTAGFTDIVNAALGAAPDDIDIALPVGVAAGVYTGSLTVRNSVTGCVSVAQTITVTVGTSITLFPDTDALACSGDATAPLAYTVTTGSPNQYSIDFNAAAQTAGFTDIVNAALGAAPDDIDIALPVGVAAGVYTGSLTVRNSVTGCVSVAQTITVTVGTTITLSPDTDAAACVGAATAPLAYTVLTGAPNQYSIDFNAAAQTAGFTDIVNAALGAAPDDIDIALPVGVAAGVYTGSLTVRNSVTGCVSPAQTITVTVGVTITLSPDTDAAACSGSATAPLAYTATTGSPNQYSIDFNPAAQTAGFTDIVNAALLAAPDDIDIALPVGVAAGVYTGSLTVRNSVTGCVSVAQTITVTVGTSITLFPDTDALACSGDATAPLAYTVTTGSPNQYSIDFNAAAQTAGFTDIVNAALGAAPDDLDIALPVGVAAGVYTGSLTVRNSVTGCVSVAQTITVTVGTTITLSPDTDAAACLGDATAPLAYTVLTGGPNQYSIDFNAAAQTAGFTDIVNAALGAAPDDIDIALPVGVAAGVYTGSLTVRNSVTGCVSPAQTITVTVGTTITLSPDTDAAACSGSATAPLAYTVTTGSPNQYSIDFNPAAQTAGFTDIVNAALLAAPDDIDIALPVGVAAGVYTGSLTVRNSVTGCVSVAQTITVTVGTSITLSPDTDAAACVGAATAPLAYTVITGGANQYSIDFNAAAQTAGFTDIVNAALGAAPDDIDIALPVGVAAGVYTGSLTVRNSVTGCVSPAQTITVTVGTTITLSPDTDAAACLGDATAPLAYTVTTGGANQYSIDFNVAAQTAGFTDIVNAALGAAPDDIDIAIPVGTPIGVYTGSLTVRNSVTGCVSVAQTITVSVGVTITLFPDTDAAACGATAPLAYTATTGGADQYSIDFNAAAQTAGFTDIVNAGLGAAPDDIDIAIPGIVPAGVYTASLTVRNSVTGCVSAAQTITVTIGTSITLSPDTDALACLGAATAPLSYTAIGGSADEYSIDFNAAAQTAGFTDIVNAALGAAPDDLDIAIPVTAPAGVYTAVLTVRNSGTGCVSTPQTITVTVGTTITLAPDTDAAACLGDATAPLAYTVITGSPNQYSIDFNAAAQTAGFTDIVNAVLLAAPDDIDIALPVGVAAGVYTGSLTVRNSVTGCVSLAQTITVSVGISITLFPDTDAEACGATAPLAYTATTGSPDQYSIDFNAAAQTAGFTDIVNAGLLAAPDDIDITIPVTAPAGIYTGSLTVRNSVTGCVSIAQTITVTIGTSITLSPDTDALACVGDATAPLHYTAVGGSADEYSIDFNAAAQTAGFTDIVNAALGAAPDDIDIAIPAIVPAGVYTASLTVRNSVTGCVSTGQTITVTLGTTITLFPDTDADACGATAPLAYTATTGNPDQYSIDFNAAAQTAGFTDIVNAALGAAPDDIDIAIPGSVPAGVYTGSLTVRNSVTGCVSAAQAITVTVGTSITLSPDTDAAACVGAATAPLSYTAVGGGADQYSIDFNVAAEGAGFTDVTNVALGAAPDDIDIAIPVTAAAGVYTATLRVRNSVTGCVSTPQTITVSVGTTITLSPDTDAAGCVGDATAPLAYTVITGSPNQYSIDFNAAAQTAGFTDIINAALLAAPDDIDIALPVGVAAGVYTGSLTVRNSVTGCVSVAQTITVSVGISITLFPDTDAEACGATAPLSYTATLGSPDQYSIDFNVAAQTAGFIDIVNAALGAAPDDIDIPVPVTAVAGVYTGTLTVSNSVTGCVSAGQTITVTVGTSITLSPDTDASACVGAATAPLAYTAVGGSADEYSIDFDGLAEGVGFTDVTNAALGAAPDDIDIVIPVTAVAGVYNATLRVRNSGTGCLSAPRAITVTVGTTITLVPGNDARACPGDATANLDYTATTGTPNEYSIDFDATAQGAGFADLAFTTLPASPIVIAVPGAIVSGVYNAQLRVRNTVTNCTSAPVNITVTIGATIALADTDAQACVGDATAPLDYTATGGNPDQYSIDFDPTAEAEGFTDVTNIALPVTPIGIVIPGVANAGVYNAILRVRNSVTGCLSAPRNITVTLGTTIDLVPSALACTSATTAPLFYNFTTGNPNQYSIDFDAVANTAGFADVTNVVLPASPIGIVIPATAVPGVVYNAVLSVRNSTTGCVSAVQSITVTMGTSITLNAIKGICTGANSAAIDYTATTGSPNEYRIDWNAAANTAGLADVSLRLLTANTITVTGIAVPAGTYNGNLYVRNSVNGCQSSPNPISLTVGTTITTANAGTDQLLCAPASFTILGANNPTIGSGQWSVVNGAGGTVIEPSNPNSMFVGNQGVTYTLRWIITSGACTPSTDDVIINFSGAPVVTSAVTVCTNATRPVLTAISPDATTYNWYKGASLVFTGPSYTPPAADLNMTVAGSTTFTVRSVYPVCGEGAPSTVVVTVNLCGPGGGPGNINCTVFNATVTEIRPTCADDDGRISIRVTGGSPSPNYVITLYDSVRSPKFTQAVPVVPGVTYNFNDLTASSNYFYQIEDGANICKLPYSLQVQTSVDASVVAGSEQNATCFGELSGGVVINATGSSTGQYYYSVDGIDWTSFVPGTPGSIDDLPPLGTYSLLIGESVGDACHTSVNVTINSANPIITATFNIAAATCNGADGAIQNIVGGGGSGSGYQFSIDGGTNYQSTAAFNGLTGGAYTLTVKDGIGCEQDFATNVTFPGFISATYTPTDAECTNNGNSGSINVAISSAGTFEVAISNDQFNAPAASEYKTYSNPSVTFDQLSKGQYFVYLKSGAVTCPTRSAPVVVNGVSAMSFDIEPQCVGTKLSIALTNIQGEPNLPFEIWVYRKFTNVTVKKIAFSAIPATASVLLSVDDHNFLQSPDEYQLQLVQINPTIFCEVRSPLVNFTTPEPLRAQVGTIVQSYPDMATGSLQVKNFSGGKPMYDMRIELDSAGSLSLPFLDTDFEEVEQNDNNQFEKIYETIPPGRYRVQITDDNGCSIELIARVPLDKSIFIPNIFTPNDDNMNDRFFIRNLPVEGGGKVKLVISSRWGKTVYSSNNYQNNWTGEGAVDGIYFYKLQINESEPITGWVEVLRGQKP